MQTDMLNSIETLNKAAIESARRLGDIQMRTLERLTQRHIEAAADYLEGGVKQMKLLGEAKDLQSAFAEQARLAGELNEKFVEHTKKTAELLVQAKGEISIWAEEGMKAAGTPFGNGSKKSA